MKTPPLKALATLLAWLVFGPTQSQAQPPGAAAWDAAEWSTAHAGQPLNVGDLVRVGPDDASLCDFGAEHDVPRRGDHTWYPEQNNGFSKIPGGVAFRRDKVSCVDGDLVLHLSGSRLTGYSAGAVDGLSRDREGFSFKYGYYEVSLLAPPPPAGVCPWLGVWFVQQFTQNFKSDGFLELDQLETCLQSPISPEHQVSTIHLWPPAVNVSPGLAFKHRQKQLEHKAVVFDGKYHEYGTLWTPDAFILYVDRREIGRFPTQGPMADFPMFPMLDVSLYRLPLFPNPIDYSVKVRWSRFYDLRELDGN